MTRHFEQAADDGGHERRIPNDTNAANMEIVPEPADAAAAVNPIETTLPMKAITDADRPSEPAQPHSPWFTPAGTGTLTTDGLLASLAAAEPMINETGGGYYFGPKRPERGGDREAPDTEGIGDIKPQPTAAGSPVGQSTSKTAAADAWTAPEDLSEPTTDQPGETPIAADIDTAGSVDQANATALVESAASPVGLLPTEAAALDAIARIARRRQFDEAILPPSWQPPARGLVTSPPPAPLRQ